VQGGTVSNVVPDYARGKSDVRAALPADMDTVSNALTMITGSTSVPGTTSTLDGGWRFAPMARTPAVTALAGLAQKCAMDLGFEVVDAPTGGVSYANLLAALGLPVLDGLGPVGGLDHSPREYILASSIVPRTALLAPLMLRFGEHA